MATWTQFAAEAPDLAAAVRARFEATKHHVLASLRRDGSPRVSGTEVDYHGDELTVGSMWEAVKARDLQRDGRFAVHANPGDSSMSGGDAKLAGVAVEIDDEEKRAYIDANDPPPGPFHLFRLDLREVVLTSLHPDGDRLVIETWRPGEPVRRTERR
ncbi:MAG: pyridoxamine 5'-phosphate oxidase family protein [Acidimicrobiia bacterium]